MNDQKPEPQNPYGQPYGSPQTGGAAHGQGPYDQAPEGQGQSPYGQAPDGRAPQPYGQAPYGQDPQPYGQDPQPYGQAPYGQAPYGATPYGRPSSDKRPGTVTAGAWIAIVMSALTALGSLFMTVISGMVGDDIVDDIANQPEFNDVAVDSGDITAVMVAIFGGLALWSIIALVLAIFTLRRSNVARILLVISSAVTILFSVIGIASGVTVVPLAAALATIVLLFVGGANDWFKRKPAIDFRGMGGADGPPKGY